MISRPRLRPLTALDADTVDALYASTRAREIAHFPLSADQQRQFLRMQSQAQQAHYARHYPGASFDAVVLDERVVGRLYVWRQPAEIRLMDISLFPQERGAGLGTFLLQALIDEAAAAGAALTLHVNSDSRARAWYQRLGFVAGPDDGVSIPMSLAAATA